MKILILHNRYRRLGGEDLVAQSELESLRGDGIEARWLETDNQLCGPARAWKICRTAWTSSWSGEMYARVRELCAQLRPDVAHIHNFWMTLTPSAHAACRDAGAATVQTLHNYRLLCANALFLRNGRVCEECLGKIPWRGVARRCYRDSFFASAAVVKMIVANRFRGTWEQDVDAFVALSEFSRGKFIAGGLPADRIFVKPNPVQDPGGALRRPSESNVVIYAGRLSPEKGLDTLLAAWARGALTRHGRLLIVGEGPSRNALEEQAAALGLSGSQVLFVGQRRAADIIPLMATARAMVLPSICFENFPRSLAEAFACGRPVVVSDLGALGDMVQQGYQGLKFPPGDTAALADALQALMTDGALADRLGEKARETYLARYTPERNRERLLQIYRYAIEHRHQS